MESIPAKNKSFKNGNSLLMVLLLFPIFSISTYGQGATKKYGEWHSIFNGKNLNGWIPKVTGYKVGENPLSGFRVEDGILKVDYSDFGAFNGRFGHLFYKEKLSSFMLHLEYRFVGELLPDAPSYCIRNSGVMVCSQSPQSMDITENWPVSIEVQLLGCTDTLKQTTGNICTPGTTISYNGVPTDEHYIGANSDYYYNGEWVSLDIIVYSGKEIINIINGDTVLVTSEPKVGGFLLPGSYPVPEGTLLKDGYIALQAEGQPVDFRNIKLKVLNDDVPGKNKDKEEAKSVSSVSVIDDFNSYRNDKELKKNWNVNNQNNSNNLKLKSKIKAKGQHSLKFNYNISNKNCGFEMQGNWDFRDCNGIQFWLKPDGSGREVVLRLNTNGDLNHFWEYRYLTEPGDRMPRWVTLPFFNLKYFSAELTETNPSPTFNKKEITGISFFIVGEQGQGIFYFDEIAGAKLQF
jgi:hypothetical protein